MKDDEQLLTPKSLLKFNSLFSWSATILGMKSLHISETDIISEQHPFSSLAFLEMTLSAPFTNPQLGSSFSMKNVSHRKQSLALCYVIS